MSIHPVYRCDVCGKPRGQANHWFIAFVHSEWVTQRINPGPLEISIRFDRWGTQALSGSAKHLCGQECAHKLLNDFLVPSQG